MTRLTASPAASRSRRGKPSAPRQIGANDNRRLVANDDRPPPKLIMLGGLPVVSLRSLDELSPGELNRISRIEAALRGRKQREASRLALEFEASLGITTEERIAALEPANDLDRALDNAIAGAITGYAETYTPPPPPKKAKRPKGHKKPKPPKVDPLEGLLPGDLTQDEIDRLTTADKDLLSSDADKRDRAKRTIANIRRAAAKRATDASLKAAKSEIEALEALRDPEVKIGTDKVGRLHLSNRDGLEALWVEGKLDDRQRAAGRRYRSTFEDAESERSLKSNALAILRRMMSGGSRSVASGEEESSAWDDLRALEDRVNRSTDRAIERGRRLLMIREVAGRGHTVRAVAGSGKAHQTHMLSLAAALDAIS